MYHAFSTQHSCMVHVLLVYHSFINHVWFVELIFPSPVLEFYGLCQTYVCCLLFYLPCIQCHVAVRSVKTDSSLHVLRNHYARFTRQVTASVWLKCNIYIYILISYIKYKNKSGVGIYDDDQKEACCWPNGVVHDLSCIIAMVQWLSIFFLPLHLFFSNRWKVVLHI